MEASQRRLRINFQDRGILSNTQKKNGLKHSWVLLKPQFQTISNVVSYLLHSFDLFDSCSNGIILSMDGFALPPFESTAIFKDKDVISVKRKGSGLRDATKATEETRPFIEDEIVEKQRIPSGARLLANEEFDEETGGYPSKTDKDEYEIVEPVRMAQGGNVAFEKRKPLPSGVRLLENEKFDKETAGYHSETDKDEDVAEEPVQSAQGGNVVSKKRKASGKIENLKKKRRLKVSPLSIQKKNVDHCRAMKTSQKKGKLANGRKQDAIANCCSQNSELISKSNEHEKKKETVHASGVSDGAKKVCRSTRRKKMKRKWSRQGSKTNVDEGEKQLPVKDLRKDLGSKDVGTRTELLAEDDSDADDDLVPVEIRPGHIRFTPTGKVAANDLKILEASRQDDQSAQKSACEDHTVQRNDWDVNKNKGAKEPYCWNGITNKKKGQKWGKENQPFFSWKEPRNHNTWASRKRQSNNSSEDFEKLVPLTDLPEIGDVLAYRLLELSSSWCPELTSFRVGKISSFDKESNKIIVVPEPEYPLDLEKKAYGDHDDDSGQPPQPSVYNEDGSLEIDFPSLVDVRILKSGDPSQTKVTEVPATANGTSVPTGLSESNKKDESKKDSQEPNTPATPGNGERDLWQEISDAFAAKKAQLSQEDSWNKKQTSSNRSWSSRTLRGSALGPTITRLRAQNGV